MENIQINGQRIWGPPRNWMGPPPSHGTEIFIKNLPEDVYEIELFRIFSYVGRVYKVRLPVHWSGNNRGYAFVRYTKISEADSAINKFNMFEIRSNQFLKVERSVDNKRLFLSAVPTDKSAEEIKSDLQNVVENIKKVYVYPTLGDSSVFRGYAFVEFTCHRDAAIAKRILTPDVCYNLFNKKCVAAWANPLPFLEENVLQTINVLFMRNLPTDIKNVTVKKSVEMLVGADAIQKVKRLNDFAFLTFKNHQAAKKAMNIIKCNQFFLGGSQVQIEWAVPRELTKNGIKNLKDGEKNPKPFSNRVAKNTGFKNSEPINIIKDLNINLTDYQEGSECFKTDPTNDQNKMKCNTLFNFQTELQSLSVTESNQLTYGNLPVTEELYSRLNRREKPVLKYLGVNKSRPPFRGNVFFNYDLLSSKNAEFSEDTINVGNVSPDSDSGSHGSEESYRSCHMKHWHGHMTYSSCTPSPALTTSSADSVTNFAWNQDESNNFRVGGDLKLF